MNNLIEIKGNIVDTVNRKIFFGSIIIQGQYISDIRFVSEEKTNEKYIIPGFVDSHIHIESSLLIPSTFGNVAIKNGVLAAICDPHEIGNVLGIEGIRFMIENGSKSNFRFYFGVPSCVPATNLETSGAIISSDDVQKLFEKENVYLLSEMMNFPGVINSDKEVIKKIEVAKAFGKPIDGHAPGLSGTNLKKYVNAGIQTDHECTYIEEAIEKIKYGMKILIREGSAAKNLKALAPLLNLYPDSVMLCSDDIHAEDLRERHLNNTVKNLVSEGYNIFNVLRAASFNPINHYKIDVGIMQKGDLADFLVIDNLVNFRILKTYIKGTEFKSSENKIINRVNLINNFNAGKIDSTDLLVKNRGKSINLISIIDKEIVTKRIKHFINDQNNLVCTEPEIDILKIVVLNRYKNCKPAIGFVKGFGLKKGAIASSISHDSHNIIAIGVDDKSIASAMNTVIENKGGICFNDTEKNIFLELPIAGLMSDKDFDYVSEKYSKIEKAVKLNGSSLFPPIMNLSFLALLVIPELKISDKGLFDFNSFSYIDLFE
jgi:adenine deaminase